MAAFQHALSSITLFTRRTKFKIIAPDQVLGSTNPLLATDKKQDSCFYSRLDFFDKKCDKMQDRASLNRGNADACDILD
jgi:hypothetical protein